MSDVREIEAGADVDDSPLVASAPEDNAALSPRSKFWIKVAVLTLTVSCLACIVAVLHLFESDQDWLPHKHPVSDELQEKYTHRAYHGSWIDPSHMERSDRYDTMPMDRMQLSKRDYSHMVEMGSRMEASRLPDWTPRPALPPITQVAKPSTKNCADAGENCAASRCCKVTGAHCYEKDATWSGCREFCIPGARNKDAPGPWSCKYLDVERLSVGAHRTGVSLFCWSVMQTHGHELELVQQQYSQQVSIFACDDWAVFSDIAIPLGDKGNKSVKTTPIGVVHSTFGGHGRLGTNSWVNTEVFFRAWEAIQRRQWHEGHAWTVKADPDAVFLPARLRQRLESKAVGVRGAYLVNCRGVKHGFFGSLEVISRDAVRNFLRYFPICLQHLPWHGWGEDLFTEQCMEMAGVDHIEDFGLVSDGKCCKDPRVPDCRANAAAFHPFKLGEDYFECLGEAEGGW